MYEAINLKKLSANAEKKSKLKTLKRSIQIAINQRHRIVHKGDLDSHGKLRDIKIKDVEFRLKKIQTFVEHADDIIELKMN